MRLLDAQQPSSPPGTDKRSGRLPPVSISVGGGSYSSYLADHISRMHVDIRHTTSKLELEQRRLYRVEQELRAAEAESVNGRGRSNKPNDGGSSHEDVGLQNKIAEVRHLEHQLEKSISELNKGTAYNESLQANIDQLRKERRYLNTIFKQLDKGICRSAKASDLVAQETAADKQAADEAQKRSKELNKALEDDRRAFHQDVDRLRSEAKREFNVQREQMRTQRHQRHGGNQRRPYMIADEEEAFCENTIQRRIVKLSFLNSVQRRQIKQHQKNIEVFEQAFATIKSSTGISDIEEIVKIFMQLETRNFSLLTYVNQLNVDIESVEIRNKELQNKLSGYTQQETSYSSKRDGALNELDQQIARTQTATKKKHKLIEDASLVLDAVRPSIWNCVNYLKQETPQLLSLGYEGDPPPMKTHAPPDEEDDNLLNCLIFIEECLSHFKMCLVVHPTISAPSHSRSAGVKKPSDLPSTHAINEDTDDEDAGFSERMLLRSELRDRAQAVMLKRRKKPGQLANNKLGEGGAGGRAEHPSDEAFAGTSADLSMKTSAESESEAL